MLAVDHEGAARASQDEILAAVARAVRASLRPPVPAHIAEEDRLLLDLGFDSLSLATLTLSLEEELGRTILLDAWIGAHPDLEDLTVGSLAAHVREVVEGEHGGR